MTQPKAETAQDQKQKTTATTNAIETYKKHKDLVVVDQAGFTVAADVVKAIKTTRKEVKNVYQPIIDRENAAVKATRSEFKKYDVPLATLEATIKGRMTTFFDEQERERRKLEAEAQEKARKQAEDAKLAEAQKLEDMGEAEASEAVLSEPVVVAPVTVDNRPKAAGISASKRWSAEVVDKMALIKAVAEGSQSLSLLEPVMPALNKMATALREDMNIPGVRAVSKTSIGARTA